MWRGIKYIYNKYGDIDFGNNKQCKDDKQISSINKQSTVPMNALYT